MTFFTKKSAKSIAIQPLTEKSFSGWLKKQKKDIQLWVESSEFKAKQESILILPSKDGKISQVLFGTDEDFNTFTFASLPSRLPYNKEGYHINAKFKSEDATKISLGWALGCYSFEKYKSAKSNKGINKLVMPENANTKKLKSSIEAMFLARDLINIPANEMGPEELVAAAKKVAPKNSVKVIVGQDLLKKNYPTIYAVGKGSSRKPRLIDFTWGNPKNPKVTLVGKGVCFDTGGLNLKPGGSMYLMKKDMGGAAHVLGIASMIMAHNLPIRLRVLIPAVENSVSGDSFRPSDIIKTRNGITVEVGDTDAEGRLILADALAEASSEKPKLLIDFATLTGAARVALGPDLPAMLTNDDRIAEALEKASNKTDDPLWRLPLWQPYNDMLKSDIADTNSITSSGLGGAITAALFLEKFVGKDIPWVHIDTFGWNPTSRPGKPKGGEALAMRAVYELIEERFKK